MKRKRSDIEISPFVPAQSPVCRWADTLLISGIAFAGVSAAIICFIKQTGFAQ